MTHHKDLIERLERANPVPDPSRLYPDPAEPRSFLHLVEQRRERMDDTKVRPIKSGEKPPRSNRGIQVAAAAFVIAVAGIGIGLALLTGGDDVAAPPATLSVEAQQEAAQQEALAVAEAHIAAFNAGDRDAVMGLFTADVSISDNFVGEWTVTDWEMLLAWDIAQGTILTAADCTVAVESSSEAVTVTCDSGTHNAPAQAIGAPPVPAELTFLVGSEGIRDLAFSYRSPDFNHTTGPHERWVQGTHPEDIDRVGFGKWNSVEEAEQNGLLVAQYAEEWAAFLDASGCVYPDNCFRILTEG